MNESSAFPGLATLALMNTVLDTPAQDQWTADDAFARVALTTLGEPGDAGVGGWVAPDGAIAALERLIQLRDGNAADLSPVLRAIETAAKLGMRLLTPSDWAWPTGLADLKERAPLALWYRGTRHAIESLGVRSIAIVGARAETGYGEHVTMEAAAGLVDRDFTIVSGAAYGIDGVAHRSALAARGTTVAFLAGGLDRYYPSGHDALLQRIAQVGAVVSEMPPGAAPTRWRFLQRNRLIAAASQALVVVEAGFRSGSLNAARNATELGRPVGAVPGPVTSPTSVGCHRLIREGAALVTNAEEMEALTREGEQA